MTAEDFHPFVRDLAKSISTLCQDESRNQGALYRAFDALDEILDVDYREDDGMTSDAKTSERLYERAGAGVQTSYSTIFKILDYMKPAEGSHLVDLGSGFGRFGLATGLWREDLRFSGYEYVGHRVAASQASARRAGIDERIRFIQQDLGDPSFEIPAADAYYLYDPFSESTYRRVLERISALGQDRPTTVIAKAHARESFRQWTDRRQWAEEASLDEGTLVLFRSRGA